MSPKIATVVYDVVHTNREHGDVSLAKCVKTETIVVDSAKDNDGLMTANIEEDDVVLVDRIPDKTDNDVSLAGLDGADTVVAALNS